MSALVFDTVTKVEQFVTVFITVYAIVILGGAGSLAGAALGAVVVNYAKTFFTSGPLAPYWLFMLGALFILVTLLLPKGIIGTFHAWWEQRKPALGSEAAASAAREDGVAPKPAE
jgi:urea transport system permease protein